MATPLSVDRQLHDLMRDHHNTMRQYFQEHGLFNGQPMMLFLIREHPGITQKALAHEMRITPASVAVSIRRMEDEGLVRREQDAGDARVHHLFLTPKGETLDTNCRQARDIIIDTLYEDFSPQELEDMEQRLRSMRQKLDTARQLFPSHLQQEEEHPSYEA